jgi:glycosyltransferase involved in cell wall biosynthesis
MRLLFFGDMAATGFGTVTTDLGRALIERGVDCRFVSQNAFAELPEPFFSRTYEVTTYGTIQPEDDPNSKGGIVPRPDLGADLLGDGAASKHLANGELWGDWKPDAVFLLGDYYGVRIVLAPNLEAFSRVPTYHYCPVEGHDLPPLWADMWGIAKPIAMSKFGQAEIAKVVGYEPPMFYHGVDTDEFRPVSVTDPIRITENVVLTSKERCKAFFRIRPDMRVLLRCDKNMPRKGYPSLLRALAPVLAEHPNVALCLKTAQIDQGGYIAESLSKLPEDIARRVLVMDMNLPRHALRALYNAADVYVSNSAEGFGLTIAEALACAVPAVGVDYSSVPEVIGPAGRVVPVGRVWDNEYGHFWALADEDAFGKAVAYYLDHPARAREDGARGPAHVESAFSWAKAASILSGVMGQQVQAVAA